jgi:hypothetical protein
MAQKKTRRTLKQWTADEEKKFKSLVREGMATSKIAKTLKRTAASVRSKAQKLRLSLQGKRG